ncbi:MAG: DsrE family protein [Alphaproteobacteria bacterium]|nr:DsrE family protein [Alphaproteobacteria bacterium]
MAEQPLPIPEPLGIVLLSGEYERAHYALLMATAAAATGRRTILFATNGGIRAFLKPRADGAPGWTTLAHPDGAAKRDAELRARGVAGFAELRQSAAELYVQLIVCETGLLAMGLTADDLDPALPGEISGVVRFLETVEGGKTLSF